MGVAWSCSTRLWEGQGHVMIAGQKVEMRRWFTFLDGSMELDQYWNTALLALVVEFLLNGKACLWRRSFFMDLSPFGFC